MKYVLTYVAEPSRLFLVAEFQETHRTLWRSFHSDGRLVMMGAFTDEPRGGTMGIFTSRRAAEEFVRLDPYISQGIIAEWTIREWREALA